MENSPEESIQSLKKKNLSAETRMKVQQVQKVMCKGNS